ncbi:AAA family ATPase [Neobacillus cucumis]|uniref:Nuclease SbcCD subunit C n=1 Tax=Neobacillus cucumis TaxID=1740721 RepID=A0A2N5HP32_9BACI|nr:SMC family ATPase [Neobacillus cucumis]PLS07286.1 ATP-dependent dsDNA exonuclease [Neobacillus cucumis]
MKPLKLIMQAFGPYAGREEIDFNQLGNRTMFVISGKTGAGKTTIFDAISYAIYGKASGEDRNGPELRSQFAKEDLLTEVSLDFSLRNKVYSITRSPQQQKKKDRGEGFTSIGAKAELYVWDVDGEKKLLASKTSDVEEKIKEIMLIDANQFRQILMIPQGEFRKLLTSDSKDKELILQRLFHTQLYKLIEEKLKQEAADLKKAVEDQEKARNEALRRIQVVTNEGLRQVLNTDPENHTVIMPLLHDEIVGMVEKLDQLTSQLTVKVQEQDKLKGQLFEAEAILKQLQTKEELKEQKAHLLDQQDLFSEKELQVQRAQKAALLSKQEELCHRLKREADKLQANINSILAEIKELNELEEQYKQQLQKELEREDDRQAALSEVNRLVNMKEDVYSFAALKKETNQKAVELKAAKEKQLKDEQRLQQLEERVASLKVQKEEIEKGKLTFLENKGKLEKLRVDFARLEKLETLLARHQKAEQDLAVISGHFENTVARFKDAKALIDELEIKWIHGQAAILAANLRNDVACPVCGSLHHPAPASGKENSIPTEDDMKAAKAQVEKWEKEKSRVEANFYQCQSEERAQKEAVKDMLIEIRVTHPDFILDQLSNVKLEAASAIKDLVHRQSKLEEQIQMLERLKSEIDSRENERGVLQKGIEQLRGMVSDLTVQFTKKETDLSRMMKVIPENLRSETEYERALAASRSRHEMLVKRLEEAKERLQAVHEKLSNQKARLKDAEKLHASKQKDLETERGIFLTRLSEQGFEKYGIYAASKRTEGEIQSLQEEIRSYREELRSVSDRLKELIELLSDVKTPDVEGIKQELSKSTSEIEVLGQERNDLVFKKRDNEEIYSRVQNLNNELKELEERFSIIGDLSDIARGQNNLRITFERYVLAAFLDDILREANVRLRKMTSGRYLLQRKTDRSKGNAQSGLELLVFDQYTGQERHVKTLSGGESFKASLSLALGLADVVQNYAGGVSLETMFIDEGFGTLDPESLDQAIESLMDIQSSGRLVGIISHVPELKERIDVRLEVIAGQTGSRTEFKFTN